MSFTTASEHNARTGQEIESDLWDECNAIPKPFVLELDRVPFYQFITDLQMSGKLSNIFESPQHLKKRFPSLTLADAEDITFDWASNRDDIIEALDALKKPTRIETTSDLLVDITLESPADGRFGTPENTSTIGNPPGLHPLISASAPSFNDLTKPFMVQNDGFCEVVIPTEQVTIDDLLSPFGYLKNNPSAEVSLESF